MQNEIREERERGNEQQTMSKKERLEKTQLVEEQMDKLVFVGDIYDGDVEMATLICG